MLKVSARSRHLDLRGDIKLYYVLAIGAFLSLFSFLWYRDFVVAFAMAACTVGAYFLLSKPPESIVVEIDEEHLKIDDIVLPWAACYGWAMVDLGDVVEFVVHTNNLLHPFYYFYLHEQNPGIKPLIMDVTQYLPYDASIPSKNPLHQGLRKFGFK